MLTQLNSSVQSRSEIDFNSILDSRIWIFPYVYGLRHSIIQSHTSLWLTTYKLSSLCVNFLSTKLALLRILRKWFFALKAPFLKVTWFLSAWLVALSGNARSSWIWWWWMVGILDYHNFLSHRHRSGFHPKFYFMLCSLVFLDLSLQSEHENETQRCKGSFSSPQIAKSIFPQGQMFAVY